MLLWTSAVLGWLVLAVGAIVYAAALRVPPGETGFPSGHGAKYWHRLLCTVAVGWGITLVWIFLDTLAALVAP